MSSHLLAALSPADLAILFEPNPYSYDSTVIDPSLPPSPFVQAMRQQEELFFAAFPEARKAAEYRENRKQQILAFLASTNANFPSTRPHANIVTGLITPLNHHLHESHMYDDVPELVPAIPVVSVPPRQHSLHRIKEEPKPEPPVSPPTYAPTPQPQKQEQPHSPALHDRHLKEGDHHSASQQIHTNVKPTSTISRIRGDRLDRPPKPRLSAPKPSYTARSRSTKASNTPGSKRRMQGKRQHHQLDGRKPTLACLFCRGRKIACGAPLPGSIGKTCNQCQRRSLRCEFPAENRRGMRKRKLLNGLDDGPDDLPGESILSL